MHLHCLAESIAASAVVQALLAVGRCRDVLPVECMSAEFWQSVSQLNYERHRERGRPAGSRTNNDGDGQLLAAAAPIPLPGYRKVRVKIGDPAAPTEVCTYLAGDFSIRDSGADDGAGKSSRIYNDGGSNTTALPRATIVFEPGLGSHTVGMCNVLSAVLDKLKRVDGTHTIDVLFYLYMYMEYIYIYINKLEDCAVASFCSHARENAGCVVLMCAVYMTPCIQRTWCSCSCPHSCNMLRPCWHRGKQLAAAAATTITIQAAARPTAAGLRPK